MPEPADDRWISDALMEAILGDETSSPPPSTAPETPATSAEPATSGEAIGPYGSTAVPPAGTPETPAAPPRRIGGPTYRPFDAAPAEPAPTNPADTPVSSGHLTAEALLGDTSAPEPDPVLVPEPVVEPTPAPTVPDAAVDPTPAEPATAPAPEPVHTPVEATNPAAAAATPEPAEEPTPDTPSESSSPPDRDIAQAPPGERPTTSDVTSAVMPDTTDDERPTLGDLAEGEIESSGDDEPSALRAITEWIAVFAGAILVALILRAFVVQSFYIPSESMESTLVEQDRVLVNKLSYRLHDVNRGDVIVFRRDPNTPGDTDDLIKRVIALPGETIELRDGQVYIDEQLLDEPYLDADVVIDDFPATTVPEGEVFVMGDNRDQSFDSRWIGTIPRDRIVGRAFVLFWPLNRVDAL